MLLMVFCIFLKTGRYRGGQFFAENDVTEEKTFHFRILGNTLFATVHFLKSPNLTPHPNPLPKGERE